MEYRTSWRLPFIEQLHKVDELPLSETFERPAFQKNLIKQLHGHSSTEISFIAKQISEILQYYMDTLKGTNKGLTSALHPPYMPSKGGWCIKRGQESHRFHYVQAAKTATELWIGETMKKKITTMTGANETCCCPVSHGTGQNIMLQWRFFHHYASVISITALCTYMFFSDGAKLSGWRHWKK